LTINNFYVIIFKDSSYSATNMNMKGVHIMDYITELLANINVDDIMTKVTDYLAGLNLQELLNKVIEMVTGLITK